jgi:hypothetical protein
MVSCALRAIAGLDNELHENGRSVKKKKKIFITLIFFHELLQLGNIITMNFISL